MTLRISSLAVLAVLMTMVQSQSNAQTTVNWFWANDGSNTVLVSDSVSGSPTATLIYVPTAVKFSFIYAKISIADANTSDFYDIGLGHCPNNDCSQPNATIDIVCNW